MPTRRDQLTRAILQGIAHRGRALQLPERDVRQWLLGSQVRTTADTLRALARHSVPELEAVRCRLIYILDVV